MTLHEGLAQAVSAKGPSKEGWIQAELWGREGTSCLCIFAKVPMAMALKESRK